MIISMDLRAGESYNKLASKDCTSAAKDSFSCLCRSYLPSLAILTVDVDGPESINGNVSAAAVAPSIRINQQSLYETYAIYGYL
ncbi:Uncharacterized protein HZ326_26055 [Fusarium oxysporum f. sp. albedinis]|nr:Uncharacterized protein HZ326_26055 [Fusarium oxysporum f. sp. albedinis]